MTDIQFNGTPEEWDALVKKNKKKLTAVEWLIEKLEIDMYQDLDDTTIKIIDQALAMEKEQKIEKYFKGVKKGKKSLFIKTKKTT